jgi:hypothetical protein
MPQECQTKSFADLKDFLHARLVRVIDLRRLAAISNQQLLHREVRLVVERLTDTENPLLNLMERERLIDEILDDTFGFGPLEMLFHNQRVREVRVESPEHILVRLHESLQPAETAFRSLEQLYLICGRLLSAAQGRQVEPAVNSVVEMEVPRDFLMTALFPASRLESPILHFRRLRGPAPPPAIPVPTLPPREQRLLIRFVKTLHEAGFDDMRRMDDRLARPVAEHVLNEFFTEETEVIAAEERARMVETILNEARRANVL